MKLTKFEENLPSLSIRAERLGKSCEIRKKGSAPETFWASRDVSFEVRKGEVMDVIGRNGSGKTTLLKILCSVTSPTTGNATINGKISAMLGVGTGMHPMMTGRENAYFAGMVLGLDRDFIDERMDSIIDFSGIGDFINRPVKTYSSGMRSRLGFAIAAQVEPEILLLDEVLAVGDVGFQKKCLARIREMRAKGSTILIVTHNMNVVKSFCDSALLLDGGQVVKCSEPDEVVAHYLEYIIRQSSSGEGDGEGTRGGNGLLCVDNFWLEDSDGNQFEAAETGKAVTLCLGYSSSQNSTLNNVSVGIAIKDKHVRNISRIATNIGALDFAKCPSEGVFRCEIGKFPLEADQYHIDFRITVDGEVADYIVDYANFKVLEGSYFDSGATDPHIPFHMAHSWASLSD